MTHANAPLTDETGHAIDAGQDHDAWETLLKKAELCDDRPHDARHSAAALLHLSGVPLRAGWNGWRTLRCPRRCGTHTLPQRFRRTPARGWVITLFGA